MTGRSRWTIEIVPRSAIRAGDVLLDIGRRGVYELRVMSNPRPLGGFAKEVDVCWPGEDVQRGFSLGEDGAMHIRVIE